MDLMVREAVNKQWSKEKEERYTDTRVDEQERGLSTKLTPFSVVTQDVRGKSWLLHMTGFKPNPLN